MAGCDARFAGECPARAHHRSPMNMKNVTAWRPNGTRMRRFPQPTISCWRGPDRSRGDWWRSRSPLRSRASAIRTNFARVAVGRETLGRRLQPGKSY